MMAHRFLTALDTVDTIARTGKVTRIQPTYVEADGPAASSRGSVFHRNTKRRDDCPR